MNNIRNHLYQVMIVCIAIYFFFPNKLFAYPSRLVAAAGHEVKPIAGFTYDAKNTFDRNLLSAWCTNPIKKDERWVMLKYPVSKLFLGIGIVNGYSKDNKTYLENSRPKAVAIYVDEKLHEQVIFSDQAQAQWIGFQPVWGGAIKFLILNLYDGKKYADTCVTEIIGNKKLFYIYELISDVSKTDSGLSPESIRSVYKPFFDEAYNTTQPNGVSLEFWPAIRLRVSRLDEGALRLLLDLSYYAYSELSVLDAELTEGLRDSMVRFLKNKPEVVVTVLQDPKQVFRGRIASAYDVLVSNFSYDPKTGKITDKNYTEALKAIGSELNRLEITDVPSTRPLVVK